MYATLDVYHVDNDDNNYVDQQLETSIEIVVETLRDSNLAQEPFQVPPHATLTNNYVEIEIPIESITINLGGGSTTLNPMLLMSSSYLFLVT